MAATYKDNGGSVDGSNKVFTYNFPVLQTEDIKVALNGVTQATTKYTASLSPANITFNSTDVDSTVQESTGAPKSGVTVRVYRETTVGKTDGNEDPKAVFAAGSSIRAGDLNANIEQALFGIHEQQEKIIQTEDVADDAITSAKIEDDAVTSALIADGTIVDGNISSTAEIGVNKLAHGTNNQILQSDNSGNIEWVTNVQLPGNLDVNTNTTVGGTLGITGTTTAAAINASGAVGVDGNFDVNTNKFTVEASTGNTTVAGTLGVTGTTTFGGQHTISSGALLNNVRVGLDASQEISTASGNLTLDSAGGTVVVDDTLSVNETISANAINAAGNLAINTDKFNVTAANGNTTIAGTLGVTGSSSFTNAITGLNGAVIDNIYIGISSDSEIDTSSGNLTLDSAGGTVVVDDNLSVNETISANAINAAGAVNVTGNLAINTDKFNINATSGNTTVAGTLGVTGQITGNVTGNVTGTATSISGVDATTDELNILDGVTANKDELNLLDGKSIVESISASSTNTQLPTALAVDTRITNLVTDVGGFRPIANETSFPSTNPDPEDNAGTIVSIKALSQSFTTGSGVTTKVFTDGAGSGNDVTITGLTQSTTYPQGRGMLVETTSTLHTYTFHRLTLDETGVAAAQAAIDDWDERYYGPLGSAPSTRPGGGSRVQGDLYFDTGDNQMKVWNNAASQWDDVASSASSNIVTLSPSFDGSETEFTCSTVPVDAQSLLLSINGVIQKPNSGTSTPSEGYVKLANGKIKLAAAPASGADYFAVSLGNTVSVGTPSPDTVGTTELKDNEVTEVKLKIHAAPSGTDKFLAYTSNGMEWAVPSYLSLANDANNRVVTGTGSGLNGEANLQFDGTGLGIGRAPTAGYLLDIAGTGAPTVKIQDTDGTNQYVDMSHNTGESYWVSRNNTTNGSYKWYQNDGTTTSTAMFLDSSKRLLIGTTDTGDAAADDLVIGDGQGNRGLSIRAATDGWSSIYFADGTSSSANYMGIVAYDHTTDALKLYSNGWSATPDVTINSTGTLEIGDGDLKIGTAGHGIDFSAQTGTSATGAATSSSPAELLDHYENGTWTPVADGAGTINGTSITYTGRYARVGQIVTIWFAASNSAGDIEIPSYKVFSGLPFASGGWRSVGRVCTEDAEITARCGDISCTNGTTILINNSGSSTGSVNIGGSLTYAIS